MGENANENQKMMIVPSMTHDLGGGFVIRRLLPFRKKRMVGPFTFFDHMGPAQFIPNATTDIRPHPHIGLSTLSYLFKGRLIHRDSLGSVQEIKPGEVNWVSAGSGIVHSERAHADDYGKTVVMEGLQFWVALPDESEDQDPSFAHYEEGQIPVYEDKNFRANVVCGKAFGLTSPVQVSSPLVFLNIVTNADGPIEFTPADANFEIAIYVINGEVITSEEIISSGSLAILTPERSGYTFHAKANSHFAVIGGLPLNSPRLIYWNFVASSREKIEAAKQRWKEDRFPNVPGETERTPLGD